MISPQELQNKKFEKAVFGGYDMAGIDEFLDVLIPDYTALYKENMSLKNKMKVLVEKVEEYRSTEDAMRKALLTAQNVLNCNACIALPQVEDETLTLASLRFHQRLGYTPAGQFHQCGYKFGRWYHMVWMEILMGSRWYRMIRSIS